tara:strand:+ start:7283 stop:7684 length:402 start_codon:yes stop_codon:yes gene_type:complete
MFITKQSWFIFLAAWLFLVATWTVLIKFLFPVVYALNYGEEILSYIMWDFWWIAHLWLAYSFLNISRYTFYIGSLISVAELIIIVFKLYLFFILPQWTIWNTNWMINKVIVLILFIFISLTLICNRDKFFRKL